MKLFTIGFTKTTAQRFFESLATAGVRRVVDVRLNNVSQLAGFAKRADLPYFLHRLSDAEYVHLPELAPTQEMLDRYKKAGGSWDAYAEDFVRLMRTRGINLPGMVDLRDGDCLLCSESTARHCHRSLVIDVVRQPLGVQSVQNL